jgi:hypothetical protein
MASLLKQKEYLMRIPADPTVSAWCADHTEDLSGNVGTIEINGDPKAAINIRPGYDGRSEYDGSRDGQAMNIMAMTPEQAFYNLAMMPGWQKWMPTYRIGEITTISGDTCALILDNANSSLASSGTGPLNINAALELSNVPIEYMSCNGSAFKEGDRVIVQFGGQDFNAPKVIGFEKEPNSCDRNLIVVWAHLHVAYHAMLTGGPGQDFNYTYRYAIDTIRSGAWDDCVFSYNDYFTEKKRTWQNIPVDAKHLFLCGISKQTTMPAMIKKSIGWILPILIKSSIICLNPIIRLRRRWLKM